MCLDQAALASKTVASDIADVNAISNEVRTASTQVSSTAATLSQMGSALSDSVSSFKLAENKAQMSAPDQAA
ncbi:MAG: methyl-accepting chemotaxis protein [Candidatus Latescibacterota bacterium]